MDPIQQIAPSPWLPEWAPWKPGQICHGTAIFTREPFRQTDRCLTTKFQRLMVLIQSRSIDIKLTCRLELYNRSENWTKQVWIMIIIRFLVHIYSWNICRWIMYTSLIIREDRTISTRPWYFTSFIFYSIDVMYVLLIRRIYVHCWGLFNKPNSERKKSVQLTEFQYGGTHGQSWTTHA